MPHQIPHQRLDHVIVDQHIYTDYYYSNKYYIASITPSL